MKQQVKLPKTRCHQARKGRPKRHKGGEKYRWAEGTCKTLPAGQSSRSHFPIPETELVGAASVFGAQPPSDCPGSATPENLFCPPLFQDPTRPIHKNGHGGLHGPPIQNPIIPKRTSADKGTLRTFPAGLGPTNHHTSECPIVKNVARLERLFEWADETIDFFFLQGSVHNETRTPSPP